MFLTPTGRPRRTDGPSDARLLTGRAHRNAHVRVYPDSNHGFLNQYPELFADHVTTFLNAL